MSTIDLQKRIKYNKSKKKKKKKTKITIDRDNGVYVAVILLVLIGLLLVFTSSSYYALYEQGDLYFFIKKFTCKNQIHVLQVNFSNFIFNLFSSFLFIYYYYVFFSLLYTHAFDKMLLKLKIVQTIFLILVPAFS